MDNSTGVTLGPLEVLGLFVGIPLLVMILVVLLVYAPSWTRAGRSTATDADSGPLWLASPAASTSAPGGPGALPPAAPVEPLERGGTSGRW